MANDIETPEKIGDGLSAAVVASPKRRVVSREFVWVVGGLVVISLGALAFKSWQNYQQGPDLRFTQDFVQASLEPNAPPHLARFGVNEQVAAFYKENGPVESILSKHFVETGKSRSGDPTYVVKYSVQAQKGPVDLVLKVQNHQGDRTVISMVYEPQY